ncbi:hypothetical protein [Caviibacter abscessus]|uniref:hypothetical protein n=1 Tax=Caviibacter abscessus TaxID=1766719 RepID=UPI00082C41FC|nr:hypothetical protein [Caviibacter abscessus]
MKKILLTSAALFTILTYAGPKADIEAANKLYEAKKTQEAQELLKKSVLVKGEEKEFEEINLHLAQTVAKTDAEIKMYLGKITANKESKTDIAKYANRQLLNMVSTDKERVALAEELNARYESKDAVTLGQLAYLYDKVENKNKYSEIYNLAMKNTNKNFIATFLYAIAENMLVRGNANGLNFANKVIALNISEISARTHIIISDYYFDILKDKTKGYNSLNSAEKLAPKSAEIIYTIGLRYLTLNELTKSYNYLQKVDKLAPNNSEITMRLFIVSSKIGKTKDEAVYASRLKKLHKANNTMLGTLLLNNNNATGAEKYYKLGLRDKNNDANLGLAYVEAAKGNKAAALKWATTAKQLKVAGAEEFIKQLNK